jgi:hypothetical protein
VLPRNQRQEALSRAYVRAIAARCGLLCDFAREYDYGIDLSLHDIARRGSRVGESGFQLDIQLKSTTSAQLTADEVLYDLEVKAYDDLREPAVGNYRVLVVVVLPPDESLWTSQTEEQLVIRGCAYWSSLRGLPPTTNQRTTRVSIPRGNVFSVEGVTALMDRIRKGEEL